VSERPRAAVQERVAPDRRAPAAPERPESAVSRAYARRDDRLRRLRGARPARAAAPAGRAQFVLLVMVLLAVGLVATLWLSTAASADSYRLQDARTRADLLSAQSERLHREVAAARSATQLASRATALGMVPADDPARLVVGADGSAVVVGEPRAAEVPPPVVPPAPPAPPVPDGAAVAGAPADGAAPAGGDAAGTGTAEPAGATGGDAPDSAG
jgi:outer membrane murein-binding lipoprotein Lpp